LTKPLKKKLSQFEQQLQSYGGTKLLQSNKLKSPLMILAGKACALYLNRIILQQKGTFSKKEIDSQNLMDQLEKLLQCKNEPLFQQSVDFFKEAETFLSPLCGIREFKLACVKTLAMIYPYLEHM